MGNGKRTSTGLIQNSKESSVKGANEDWVTLITAHDLFIKYNPNFSEDQRAHLFPAFLKYFDKYASKSNSVIDFEQDIFGEGIMLEDFLPGLPFVIDKVSEKDFNQNPTNTPNNIELEGYKYLIANINLKKIEMTKTSKQAEEHFAADLPTTFPPKLTLKDEGITFVSDDQNLSNTREPEIMPNPQDERYESKLDTTSRTGQFQELTPLPLTTSNYGSGIRQKSQRISKKVGFVEGIIQYFRGRKPAKNSPIKSTKEVAPNPLGAADSSGCFFDKEPWIRAGKLRVLNDTKNAEASEATVPYVRPNSKNVPFRQSSPKM